MEVRGAAQEVGRQWPWRSWGCAVLTAKMCEVGSEGLAGSLWPTWAVVPGRSRAGVPCRGGGVGWSLLQGKQRPGNQGISREPLGSPYITATVPS